MIARQILCKDDEMPAGLVFFAFLYALVAVPGHIHFAAEDGLEGFQPVLFPLLVDIHAVVVQFLHAEHIAVIG